MTRVVSKKLRDSARGQSCTLRLPGCGFDDGTVVLAHLPCGQRGIGMKGPDVIACFACDHCHSVIDGRRRGEFTEADLLRALAETQLIWIRDGLLVVKGGRMSIYDTIELSIFLAMLAAFAWVSIRERRG